MLVVLVGGFGVPARALGPLRRDLEGAGHEVAIAPLGWNLDCGERAVGRVFDVLPERAALVGWSRGGLLAKVVAVRAPERVERLVTVVTPWVVGPPTAAAERIGRALRLPSAGCGRDACCERLRHDVGQEPEVPWTALWSSTDRVAGEASRLPHGIDLRLGHVAAVRSPAGRRAIVDALRG